MNSLKEQLADIAIAYPNVTERPEYKDALAEITCASALHNSAYCMAHTLYRDYIEMFAHCLEFSGVEAAHAEAIESELADYQRYWDTKRTYDKAQSRAIMALENLKRVL